MVQNYAVTKPSMHVDGEARGAISYFDTPGEHNQLHFKRDGEAKKGRPKQ